MSKQTTYQPLIFNRQFMVAISKRVIKILAEKMAKNSS
jgi:hypothetical protein